MTGEERDPGEDSTAGRVERGGSGGGEEGNTGAVPLEENSNRNTSDASTYYSPQPQRSANVRFANADEPGLPTLIGQCKTHPAAQ